MRIGLFTDRYFPQTDGVGVSVDMFAKDLRALGHTVFILCPKGATNSKHNHSDHIDGPDVIRFRSLPGIWFEGYRDTFPWTPKNMRMVKDLNLDIVHIQTPGQIGMMGIYVAKSFDLPLVDTYHTDYVAYMRIYKRVFPGAIALSFLLPIMVKDSSLLRDASKTLLPERNISQWNAMIGKRMITAMHNSCDLIIAVSQKSKRQLMGYKTTTPIEILPTGIDWEEINQATTYNLRSKFSISEQSPILLYLGRIGEEKNLQLAIRALPYILEHCPKTIMIFAGPGTSSELEKFRDLSASLGVEDKLIFTGALTRSESMGAFASADIFIFPSTTDTQGIVINEAAAHHKPIVYVDDMISQLTLDGETGLHAKNNAKDFAKKCVVLIKDPKLRVKLGTKAYQLAKKLSGKNQAQELLNLYSKLIESYEHKL